MENRISAESLAAIYDSGCQGLAFERSILDSSLFWEPLDFDEIIRSPNPQKTIASLSPQRLYYSLMDKGPSDCLEVLALLTPEQFQRILDYDVWKRDELVPQRVLYWTDLLRQADPEKAYQKFCDLEEEYQLATLTPFLRIYDQEEYEEMNDVDQDKLFRLPGDAFFYAVETEDVAVKESILGLLDCIMVHDMKYLIALIAHASYLPKNESAQTAAQFRRARLEEDGFISYEESLSCFSNIEEVSDSIKSTDRSEIKELAPTKSGKTFLDEVLSYGKQNLWTPEEVIQINQSFAHLANHLCTASQIESDDISSLKFIFTNSKSLCSLALEHLSSGNIHSATQILTSLYPKALFKTGLGLLLGSQKKLVDKICMLEAPGHEKIRRFFLQKNYARLLESVDKYLLSELGFETCELIKGIFNRYPQHPAYVNGDTQKIRFFPVSNHKELKKFIETTQRIILCLEQKYLS